MEHPLSRQYRYSGGATRPAPRVPSPLEALAELVVDLMLDTDGACDKCPYQDACPDARAGTLDCSD